MAAESAASETNDTIFWLKDENYLNEAFLIILFWWGILECQIKKKKKIIIIIIIKIQDGRQNGRLWNKWVKNWGYKIRITLMKHFQLFSYDEES